MGDSTEHYRYQQYHHYDPSHPQSYYPSTATQAYYAYADQQYDHHHHQHNHAYYPPQDYSLHYHQGNAPVHPPGVPLPCDPTQDQHNAYYTQGTVENQRQLYHGSDPDGLNSGSVAGMTQYAGTMSTALVAIQEEIGHSAHRGGGRRGGKPFQGGGRGHFGYCGPKQSGSAIPFRGRGRGKGGGRHIPSNGASSTSGSTGAPSEGPNARMPPPASGPGQASASVPVQVPAAPHWPPPPRIAWCEICRVDCNTVEILEQHKNGKRHKKNLRAHQSLQSVNKRVPGQQDVQMPILKTKPHVVEPEKVERSEEKQPGPENLPLKANVGDIIRESEQQEDIDEKFEIRMADSAAELERKPSDHPEARGHGFKRKIRGGRGGKYVRTIEGRRRPADPPKPKEVILFICELCKVKCESKVVFDSHLAGKKHLSNLKRFHGHRALYGEAGLQALCPSNFSGTQASSIPQVQQVVNDPQVVLAQLLSYMLSQAQAPGFVASQVPGLAALPVPTPAVMSPSSFGTRYHPDSQTQGSQAKTEDGSKIPAVVDTMSQKQPVSSELRTPPSATADSKSENDAQGYSLCHNSSVSVPSEKNYLGAQQVLSDPASVNDVSTPECDIGSSGVVAQPGMEGDMQEPGQNENPSIIHEVSSAIQ